MEPRELTGAEMLEMKLHETVKLSSYDGEHLYVMRVIGGWIYNRTEVVTEDYESQTVSVFVPEPVMDQIKYVERILKFENDALKMAQEVRKYYDIIKELKGFKYTIMDLAACLKHWSPSNEHKYFKNPDNDAEKEQLNNAFSSADKSVNKIEQLEVEASL